MRRCRCVASRRAIASGSRRCASIRSLPKMASRPDGTWSISAAGRSGARGVIVVEATAVEPRGRISARDLGLWNEEQAAALAPIASFMTEHGAVPVIQLAHAGRKAQVPDAIAPSAIAFEKMPVPQEMGPAEIEAVIGGFERSTRLAVAAASRGSRSMPRTATCCTSFSRPSQTAGRTSTAAAWRTGADCSGRSSRSSAAPCPTTCRSSSASARPIGSRAAGISTRAWNWRGCSSRSGSISSTRRPAACRSAQQVKLGPGYQVPFAERIRREANIPTAAVGLITDAAQADAIIREGKADAVLIARASLRNPYWPIHAARQLGARDEDPLPIPAGWYGAGGSRRLAAGKELQMTDRRWPSSTRSRKPSWRTTSGCFELAGGPASARQACDDDPEGQHLLALPDARGEHDALAARGHDPGAAQRRLR